MVVPTRLANRMRRVCGVPGRGIESSNAGDSSGMITANSTTNSLSCGHRFFHLRQQLIHVALGIGLVHDHGALLVRVEIHDFLTVVLEACQRRSLLLILPQQTAALLLQALVRQSLLDRKRQVDRIARLEEKSVDLALVDRAHRRFEAGLAREDHPDGMRELLAHRRQKYRPRHPRHLLIGNDHIDVMALEQLQGRGAGDGRQNLVRLAPQSALERIRDIGLVVDEKDGGVDAWFHFCTLARNGSATLRINRMPSSTCGSSSTKRTRVMTAFPASRASSTPPAIRASDPRARELPAVRVPIRVRPPNSADYADAPIDRQCAGAPARTDPRPSPCSATHETPRLPRSNSGNPTGPRGTRPPRHDALPSVRTHLRPTPRGRRTPPPDAWRTPPCRRRAACPRETPSRPSAGEVFR